MMITQHSVIINFYRMIKRLSPAHVQVIVSFQEKSQRTCYVSMWEFADFSITQAYVFWKIAFKLTQIQKEYVVNKQQKALIK